MDNDKIRAKLRDSYNPFLSKYVPLGIGLVGVLQLFNIGVEAHRDHHYFTAASDRDTSPEKKTGN